MAEKTDDLETAKSRIRILEAELETAKTPKQEDKVEDKLTNALKRLEALEQKYQPKEEEEEEEEEDGDQCPVCGYVLNDIGNEEYYCPRCKEYFEEE